MTGLPKEKSNTNGNRAHMQIQSKRHIQIENTSRIQNWLHFGLNLQHKINLGTFEID